MKIIDLGWPRRSVRQQELYNAVARLLATAGLFVTVLYQTNNTLFLVFNRKWSLCLCICISQTVQLGVFSCTFGRRRHDALATSCSTTRHCLE